ncbi:hypothetical protein BXA13_07515, partial [Campylobacter lari]|nr:hypothetical protein [Campylobacter lari]
MLNNGATINTITNSGTIKGESENGIRINGSTIYNITNQGTIHGNNSGISISGGKINTVINNGNIISKGSSGTHAGIMVLGSATIESFIHSGVIQSNSNGIAVAAGKFKKLEIKNGGKIIAAQDGISIGQWQNLGDLSVDNGDIYGLESGIRLNEGSNANDISIKNGGKLHGNKNGVYLFKSASIKEKISLTGSNSFIAGKNAGIHNNGTIGSDNNNGSSVNNGNVIDLQDGATIAALSPNKNGGFNYNTEGNAILNNGLIKGNINLDGGSNIYGKINNSDGTIQGNIALNNKSNIFGGINNSKTITGNISLDNKSNIVGVVRNNENGVIKGSIDLKNESYIESIVNNGTMEKGINLEKSIITSINNEKTIQGSIDLKEKSHIDNIINSGTIVGGINLEKSTIGSIENSGTIGNGGIKLDESQVGSITNNKGGKADLELKNNSVVGTITNNGDMEIKRDETSSIGKFANNGNLKNTFENKDTLGVFENSKDAILEQGLVNDNGIIGAINNAGIITSINNTLNNKTKDDKDKAHIGVISNTGTIGREIMPLIAGDHSYGINNSGTIDMLENTSSGVILSGINNSGAINLSNQNDIYGGIANSGTINLINASSLNTTKNDDNDKAKIYGGIDNSGTMSITNYGEINGGITNSGTLTLSNGHVVSKPGGTDWDGGTIGKNTHGYHLENNNGGKISIDGWYFDALEYKGDTQEDKNNRLENSIIVGGDNIKGISADKIYVNTKDLELKTVYDANTFFANEKGESVGQQTNNNAGVDGNNIFSLSGIYDFIGLGEGKYVASLNVAELSGKTLAKSMVYSSRLRSINISNILRDVTTQNFQTEFSQVLDMELSKKGEAYGNDADLLAELEDIFIPNKNIHAKNHSFLIPYYNHSSIKIGK